MEEAAIGDAVCRPGICANGRDETVALDLATDLECVKLLQILFDQDYEARVSGMRRKLDWLRRRGFVYPSNLVLTHLGREWVLRKIGGIRGDGVFDG
jgi:hypothetical protein